MDPAALPYFFLFISLYFLSHFICICFVVFKIAIVTICLNVNKKLEMIGKIFNTTVHCNLASNNVSSHSAHLPIPHVSLYTTNSQSPSTTYNAYFFLSRLGMVHWQKLRCTQHTRRLKQNLRKQVSRYVVSRLVAGS